MYCINHIHRIQIKYFHYQRTMAVYECYGSAMYHRKYDQTYESRNLHIFEESDEHQKNPHESHHRMN